MRKSFIVYTVSLLVSTWGWSNRCEGAKVILFSPINVEYLKDTAKDWADRGFSGFMIGGIFRSFDTDVWGQDGDTATKGKDDKLFQTLLACNEECAKYGITENFMKVGFFGILPDYMDEDTWKDIGENFRQAAIFARDTKCRGMAIDTEYTYLQYSLDWKGYDYERYSKADLKKKAYQRGIEIVRAILSEFPQAVIVILPETDLFRPESDLWRWMFKGMVKEMAVFDAAGGLHFFTEFTYHITSPFLLKLLFGITSFKITSLLEPEAKQYWKTRCTIGPGSWPLGYAREIYKKGKLVGYGGRKQIYGDKLVGPVWDKGPWYSARSFCRQLKTMSRLGKRYCWVYTEGNACVQYTEEEFKRYSKGPHYVGSYEYEVGQPLAYDIEDYYDVVREIAGIKER